MFTLNVFEFISALQSSSTGTYYCCQWFFAYGEPRSVSFFFFSLWCIVACDLISASSRALYLLNFFTLLNSFLLLLVIFHLPYPVNS